MRDALAWARVRWLRWRRSIAGWLRRAAEQIDVPVDAEPNARFRVFRTVDGSKSCLYRGESGREAVTVWEHHTKVCTDHIPPCHQRRGEYVFYDGDARRGDVTR